MRTNVASVNYAAQPQLPNNLLSAQACVVRRPLAPQPAAQGVLDDVLEFTVVHGGENCKLVRSNVKEQKMNLNPWARLHRP